MSLSYQCLVGVSTASRLARLRVHRGPTPNIASNCTLNHCSPPPHPARPLNERILKQSTAAFIMSSTGQAASSTQADNVQLIIDALADYTKETGFDLSKNPFAAKLKQSSSPEAILQLLQEREKAFKGYRNENRRLINCLNPTVKVLHRFSDILSKAAGKVSQSHRPSSESSNVISSDPLPANNHFVCWHRHSPQCTSSDYVLQSSSPIMYEHVRLLLRFHRATMLSWTSSSIWAVS